MRSRREDLLLVRRDHCVQQDNHSLRPETQTLPRLLRALSRYPREALGRAILCERGHGLKSLLPDGRAPQRYRSREDSIWPKIKIAMYTHHTRPGNSRNSPQVTNNTTKVIRAVTFRAGEWEHQ